MSRSALRLILAAALVLPACRDKAEPPAPSVAPRPYVVGIFQSVDSPTGNEVRRGILQAFSEAGLRDGRDVVVTIRIANNDIAEVQKIARELADGRVDLIVTDDATHGVADAWAKAAKKLGTGSIKVYRLPADKRPLQTI
ncbi:MAG: hypothetical protein HGA24_00625, partial [Candidatus Aminicenantes bacterium]|nr:hypothetical protein [Candidatus Aminicenantes bacterium]